MITTISLVNAYTTHRCLESPGLVPLLSPLQPTSWFRLFPQTLLTACYRGPPPMLVLDAKVMVPKLGPLCVTHYQLASRAINSSRIGYRQLLRSDSSSQLHLSALWWPTYYSWHCLDTLFWLQAVSCVYTWPSSCFFSHLMPNSQYLLIYQNNSNAISTKKSFLITTLVESIVSLLPLTTKDSLPTSIRAPVTFYCPYL